MSHCRTPISRTCSFVTVEMLNPVNRELSCHTAFTGHHSYRSCRQCSKPNLTGHHSCRSCRQCIKSTLTVHHSCRSCRQYIKPILTVHLSCRSCRQYIKPTLTIHHSCRSCRQYIKPTLSEPVDSLFSRHSVQYANSPPASYCLNIYFCIIPSSQANK
jgi:hypothetical protein